MMSSRPTWWVPSALWSRDGRAHLRWLRKRAKADDADRRGRTFEYVHPLVGPFVYHPNDYLSRRIFLYDNFERAELRFAVDETRRGGTVLDVGANIGLYTAACASAANGRGAVIALEPGPSTFAKLSETCRRLSLRNVTTLQRAAGRTNGSAFLVRNPAGNDVHQHLADSRLHDCSHLVEVQTQRLDEVTEPGTVTLLKVDVEGHEMEALDGAARILANGTARLIVEFFPAGLCAAGSSPDELWRRLTSTHHCTAIARHDGSILPSPKRFDAAAGDDTWNTLWVPR